jgi:hypothetical protein
VESGQKMKFCNWGKAGVKLGWFLGQTLDKSWTKLGWLLESHSQ